MASTEMLRTSKGQTTNININRGAVVAMVSETLAGRRLTINMTDSKGRRRVFKDGVRAGFMFIFMLGLLLFPSVTR